MNRWQILALALGVLGVLGAGAAPAAAQQPPNRPPANAQAGQDTTELIFRREVFTYPTFQRRNPFASLLTGSADVRYEQLTLLGIAYAEDPSAESIVLLSAAGAGASGGAPGSPGSARTRRLREGESWGEVRIVEIRRDEVVVEVVVFGTVEQRIMRSSTRGQGGS